MANPIYGKDKVLKFRLLKDIKNKDAAKLALQMEHTIKYDTGQESKQTKDGPINTGTGLTTTIEISAISTRDEVNKMLRDSVLNQEDLEVWEIDLGATPVGGKYPVLYGRGRLSSWEDPANVEEAAEFSTTLNIDGTLQSGFDVVTDMEKQQIQYVYTSMSKQEDKKPEPETFRK